MSREPEQSAAALVTTATARLGLAADGHDIPANVDGALRSILIAAFERDGSDVTGEALLLCVAALAGALEPTTRHFGDDLLPSTVETGMRSASGVVRSIGVPMDDWSTEAKQQMPNWVDWVRLLLADMEAKACLRRITTRLEGQTNSPPGGSPRLH